MDYFQDLLDKTKCITTPDFFGRLNKMLPSKNIKLLNIESLELLDKEFVEDIKIISQDVSLSFGKTVRDLRLSLKDDMDIRTHEVLLKYKGIKKLTASAVNLPYSNLEGQEYSTIKEVVNKYSDYINILSTYFNELESLDEMFTVMEPLNPTFKDDYRRISLDDKVWLHVEIQPTTGLATNVHLMGQAQDWENDLSVWQSWDHDKAITENIMVILDKMNKNPLLLQTQMDTSKNDDAEERACGICFCVELPDAPGVPQPLCQNPKCGVLFHRSCLYQWLVVCPEGTGLLQLGVVIGSCPTCLQPITYRKDDY